MHPPCHGQAGWLSSQPGVQTPALSQALCPLNAFLSFSNSDIGFMFQETFSKLYVTPTSAPSGVRLRFLHPVPGPPLHLTPLKLVAACDSFWTPLCWNWMNMKVAQAPPPALRMPACRRQGLTRISRLCARGGAPSGISGVVSFLRRWLSSSNLGHLQGPSDEGSQNPGMVGNQRDTSPE